MLAVIVLIIIFFKFIVLCRTVHTVISNYLITV